MWREIDRGLTRAVREYLVSTAFLRAKTGRGIGGRRGTRCWRNAHDEINLREAAFTLGIRFTIEFGYGNAIHHSGSTVRVENPPRDRKGVVALECGI